MREIADISGNGMGVGLTKQALLEEELTSINLVSESVRVNGNFNISATGTFEGTLEIQRSLDDGFSFDAVTAMGVPIDFTTEFNESMYEPEPQALYRIAFSAYTSGSVDVRIGK